jgi:phosphoribosylaminoimidazolecarboxamide formyltransferase/IMP cyclohydrolase
MLRSAAKNHEFVTAIIDPTDYETVINEIKENGDTTPKTRLYLAQKVFEHTANYDKIIAETLAVNSPCRAVACNSHLPGYIDSKTNTTQTLRYGENPHQSAKYHINNPEINIYEKIHGKELSYNNLLDIDAALKTIMKFNQPTVAILKHTNPCGIAQDDNLATAYQKAFATDTISPFGGIVVLNRPVSIDFVNEVNKIFTEVIIAPNFEDQTLELLQKKSDRRLIKYNPETLKNLKINNVITSCLNGYLEQSPDLCDDNLEEWTYPTGNIENQEILNELIFAWQVVKMLKSNAICFTKNKQTIGLGIGQTSRIDSMNIAIDRAIKMEHSLAGCVCASDGFFPFTDSIDKINEIGVKYIIQPGGSKADPDVIEACKKYGITLILTGRRHFRH